MFTQSLFRVPLLPQGQVWDSTKAVESGRVAEPIVVRLPTFGVDSSSAPAAPGSCNTLVVRGEYFRIPGYDRVFGGISIGDAAVGAGDPASTFAHDVVVHVAFRIDPGKAPGGTTGGAAGQGGGGAGAGGAAAGAAASSSASGGTVVRYRYLQASKISRRWDTTRAANKVFTPSSWPFQEGKPFWLRVVLDRRGVFSYVNGKAFSFTPFPPDWKPLDPHSLIAQVPIAGDAGEKATWRVHGMWWGTSRPDEAGEALYRTALEAMKNTQVSVVSAEEVYVTGLPSGGGASEAALREALLEAYRAYDVVAVRVEGAGAATVTLRGSARTAEAIAATNRRALVLGSLINAAQATRQVSAASLMGDGGGGGGGGGGAAASASFSGGSTVSSGGSAPQWSPS